MHCLLMWSFEISLSVQGGCNLSHLGDWVAVGHLIPNKKNQNSLCAQTRQMYCRHLLFDVLGFASPCKGEVFLGCLLFILSQLLTILYSLSTFYVNYGNWARLLVIFLFCLFFCVLLSFLLRETKYLLSLHLAYLLLPSILTFLLG